MGIIENIVGRCHVGMKDTEVIDYVVSRLADGIDTWRAMTTNQQKSFTTAILRAHADNINLYLKVQSGRF